MDELWGETLPAPADKVIAHQGGDVIEAAGLRLTAHDTPGHARHHFVYQLGDVAFTGDLAGVRRPESRYVRIPTPPPEFELAPWLDSVARMQAQNFRQLYLTHYGPLVGATPAEQWDTVIDLLPQYVELVRAALSEGLDRAATLARLSAWEQERLAAIGVPPEQWPMYDSLGPNGMAIDGILRYWKKQGLLPAAPAA
jgi:glyoxylase-like metal-dependent hydrolase (beta-lactamase superfamily II)